MFNTVFRFAPLARALLAAFVFVVMAGQVLADPDDMGKSTVRKSPEPTTKKSTKVGHFMSLEKSGELIPLKSFISTHKHFDEATIGTAYAESWALTHYLNRLKRKQLKTYVEIILWRPKNFKTSEAVELADFEKAFGKLDTRWEKAWKEWMKKVRL